MSLIWNVSLLPKRNYLTPLEIGPHGTLILQCINPLIGTHGALTLLEP